MLTGIGTAALSASPLAAIAIVIIAWIKIRPRINELANERETGLVDRLTARVDLLEKKLTLVEAKLAASEAANTILRHDHAGEKQMFDMFLELLESDPGRAADIVPRIRALRHAKAVELATEKGAMAGAMAGAKMGEAY